MKKRHLGRADLYDPPLTSFGEDAVEMLFSEEQVEGMLGFVETLEIMKKGVGNKRNKE